jgi:hypothetical protein
MKRGFVYPDANVAKLNPHWYYNWGPQPTPGVGEPPFVPMVWGSHTQVPTRSNIVLGFNEPDGAAQSNLTPQRALDLWPSVRAAGALVGSPATAGSPVASGSWLSQFAGEYDFVCLHWYGPAHPQSFLDWLDQVHQQYQKPIWITEFAVADWSAKGGPKSTKWTQADVLAFLKAVVPVLEYRDYVQRYSWKTRTLDDPCMWFSSVFNNDGSLTELGEWYKNQ